MPSQKIIIDTDPGQDDAIGILLALASPAELDVLGIVTVAGNVPLSLTSRNALKLCELAKKPEIALKRLKELSGRKISKKSPLYVQIHFELGTLYHLKENWDSALRHFRFAAKASAPEEFKNIQKVAEENAKQIADYLKSIKASQG